MLSATHLLLARWLALASGLVQPGATVTCRGPDAGETRTWEFTRTEARWQLRHWRDGRTQEAVRLLLPASTNATLAPQLTLAGRTSNGGIDVALRGVATAAVLDVYVNYELEVNVDASLTPRIDELNTNGPTGVRCEITGAGDVR